ncbi:endonuclease [Pseudomonas phage PhiPA3]|uniref:Uncharacterized protein 328 n=1 Tax=Pseudomonas phage PhiPA3 TaxID=998086 RepID=F8SJG4_BPPA3|nr:endonuclease [Pseudomonas phage PhiPA3]AEH03751.1 hypothetical protein [Pseudomonas phage PhiPA3]
MFYGESDYRMWSSTTHGRGKRKEIVTTGAYCVVHVGTGKFIVGTSKNVSTEVDRLIVEIKSGRSKWPKFNKLVSGEPENSDLELLEFPANMKDAKAIEARIRKAVVPSWLLLN